MTYNEVDIFKVYNLIINFNICTYQWNYHFTQDNELIFLCNRSFPFWLTSPALVPRQPLISFMSIMISLHFLGFNYWNQKRVCTLFCFFSLHLITLIFTHVVNVSVVHCWVVFHYMIISQFIHLPVDKNLDCFQFIAITNKVSINIMCKSLCDHMLSFLLGKSWEQNC